MNDDKDAGRRSYAHRWLLLIPFLWQVGMLPFVNDVAWRPFSLPFPMVWQMAGIILTSIILAILFKIDQAQEGPEQEDVAATARGDLH
ncbi:Protein of unknown function [Sphingomonas laterariae]|uniref:Uncharacterized protein n=1 Tax=Edaphosphingomonas laterariae TaxID=861865 RepID=A0A239EBQ0_9SPHN|nr:DUF3311 domain-containing protein [Sphingomonas laterariae]SNS41891.1 Protein of unknown function [Sphingomonas laterariae]